VPSVLLRGASTNVVGTLGYGVFGGGINSTVSNFSARSDTDVQVLWQLDNLGLGNWARVKERRAEKQIALLELFRTQDRIAAQVVQAYAEAQAARAQLADAETEVAEAIEAANKNVEGLGQTKPAGRLNVLVVRPQEAVAALQALAQAYTDYYGAVADYDRAQFRLYRALGQPAQAVANHGLPGGCPSPDCGTPAQAAPQPTPTLPPPRPVP
jgi:outer membrane protein TolC